MIIAGLQKTTVIDYPGKIACVVFLAMCNFRCPWCYSAELVLPLKIAEQPKFSEQEFFNFLKERVGLLDGVVVCGGEPTINKELPNFIEKIKKMGFFVKLDTNGSNPAMLKDLVNAGFVDYVAMDIKASPNNKIYKYILREGANFEDIQESVKFLKNSNINFEFRTTVVPKIHQKEEFKEIASWIGGENVTYYLQGFRPEKTIDPEFSAQGGSALGGERIKPFSEQYLKEIAEEISPHFKLCQLR